jgi:hypothetical protein
MSYKEWDALELAKQLKVLGFSQYCRQFQANEIAGLHLRAINEEHLKEMGIPSVGHRVLLLRRFADIISGNATQPAVVPIEAPKRIELQPKKTDPPSADGRKQQAVPAQKRPEAVRPNEITTRPNETVTRPNETTARLNETTGRLNETTAKPNQTVVRPNDITGRLNETPGRLNETPGRLNETTGRLNETVVRPNQLPAGKHQQKVAIDAAPEAAQAAAKQAAAGQQVICQFCGRKFPPDAAKRHIPVCERFNAGRAKKR